MTLTPPNCGASMARRSGPHGAAPVGGKRSDPDEPEDHALGRSRGGWGSRIRILWDAEGRPLHFQLSAGQVHDSTMLDTLLTGADETLHDEDGVAMAWPLKFAGDKGYRAAWIDEYLLGRTRRCGADRGRPGRRRGSSHRPRGRAVGDREGRDGGMRVP
jgi:hypothetical protein